MKKKTKKLRGHKTLGHGGMKRGRGKGEKGGTGYAGAGKHKAASLKRRWGKHGFKRHVPLQSKKTINIRDLNTFEGDVNLTELGYAKLLGSGHLHKPMKVTVKKATSKAIEKIKTAGGEIITE